MKAIQKILLGALCASPILLFAFSDGPVTQRTGAPADGGLDCSACHRGATVNDGRGALRILVQPYVPGVRQTITVRLEHPEAQRWGFQLTARLESDQTKPAGVLHPNDEVKVRCGAAPGTDGPCGAGVAQFAEHIRTSTGAGTGTGRSWTFDWTPPETNVGPVVFYAAGNAANNNNNNQGDFIYTNNVTTSPNAAGGPRPAITRGGVADAFNYQTTFANNSWITIVGTNLAPATRTWEDAIQGDQLPTTLSGVQVKVNNKLAPIYFISPTQINALAPTDDAVGDVNVVVTTAAGDSEALVIRRAANAPAFFAPFAQGGRLFVTAVATGSGTTYLGKVGTDPRVTRAARRGETIQLYGSGFGAVTPVVTAERLFQGAPALNTAPTIRLGESVLTIAGNGNLVGPGLYQFNVTIPASAATGDLPLVATVGGVSSPNTVFLTVE
ncbi:MAG: IPT/TIG domain-containing protein [Bryobacterales bacterium]|nr:IPT/TIG domain-containing protein [Bryobacterales bacterium]